MIDRVLGLPGHRLMPAATCCALALTALACAGKSRPGASPLRCPGQSTAGGSATSDNGAGHQPREARPPQTYGGRSYLAPNDPDGSEELQEEAEATEAEAPDTEDAAEGDPDDGEAGAEDEEDYPDFDDEDEPEEVPEEDPDDGGFPEEEPWEELLRRELLAL